MHEPPLGEITQALEAAHRVGIRRVHYTGGEPTVRADFLDILAAAQTIGFSQQIVTTNGFRLHRMLDEAVKRGLTRVIVSLDTLCEDRNKAVTRADHFRDAVQSIEHAVALLPTLTKLSCCTMRSTLTELPSLVAFAQKVNANTRPGKLAIKLNQFFPSNPAQLTQDGAEYWRHEFVDIDEICSVLAKIGELRPVLQETVEGDNPSYRYYKIGETGVLVAVLGLFSWGFPCGGCWKLRISPQGLATICINHRAPPTLWGKPLEEKVRILQHLTGYRESEQFERDYANRKHYRAQLGELRFDRGADMPRSIEYFQSLLAKR